ncbi:uncharacterized protein LOC124152932 [Haliotis rufescens]|uniref:uncharacterized protein LOC124152932 n=2 Tax=Haliotis TaxID=6452 RepID=UPI00201FAC45|nr:uncharacterized protein LOC124152932 [Haliotis rufescens]
MSVLTEKEFSEALPNSLDLFELPPYQTSILQHYYENVRPLSVITDSSPVEFQIPNGGKDYIDLSKTRLHVKLKVTHTDKTPLADKEKVGPVNLTLHSLWNQVSVFLQGQQVSSSNAGYPYKALMETVLDYGADTKTSQLTSQLYYKDSGVTVGDFNSADPYAGSNDGLINRGSFIAGSKSLTLTGPLMEDVFGFDRHLVNGVDVGLKLFRSNTTFVLMSDETDKHYTVELQDVYLKVCKLRINDALIVAHNKQFEKANALYPYERSMIKMASVASSSLSFNWDAMFQDEVPSRLVVALVRSDGVNGSYTVNPFCFQGDIVKSMGLYLNGTSVPGRPLESNDVEAYAGLYDWNNEWRKDKGLNLDRTEFSVGHALYVFNLQDIQGDRGEYLNLVKSGNLRLEVQFAQALAHTFNVIALAKFPALIEIDQSRNVFLK